MPKLTESAIETLAIERLERLEGPRRQKRQIDSAPFERAALGPAKLSAALRELHPAADQVFD
jgi:hypothetical protein